MVVRLFYNSGATLDPSRALVEEVFNTLIAPYKKGDHEVTLLRKRI
jgi:hypothetical protein